MFEGCSVSSINVYHVIALTVGKILSASLTIDAMWKFLPILNQVPHCFEENSSSDVIYSSAEAKQVGNSEAKYLWESVYQYHLEPDAKAESDSRGLAKRMTDDEIMDKVLGSSRAFKPGRDMHSQLADKNIELRLPVPFDPNDFMDDASDESDEGDAREDAADLGDE
ncbi:hypothetical protein Tco_1548863 [Tanacetum coccineum]